MEGAVVLCVVFLFVLIILLIVLIVVCSNLARQLAQMLRAHAFDRDRMLLGQLGAILQELKMLHAEKEKGPEPVPEIVPRPVEPLRKEIIKPEIKLEPGPEAKPEIKLEPRSEAKPEIKLEINPRIEPAGAKLPPPPAAVPPQTRKVPAGSGTTGSFEFVPSWITDWIFVRGKYRTPGVSAEYAAATAWLIRVGVLILLFGIGFLAKYMIERNLFPPSFRVAGMFLLAVVLFFAGLRMASTKYSAVALGIIGLSFATGYLSIFTGSRLYGLIGVPWAFGAMIVLTAFCMTFSVRRDYLFPALVGVLGAYLTPFLLNSRGFSPEWQLGYLTVVTAGVLFCAFFRSWNFLNWLSLVFCFIAQTVILGWIKVPAREIVKIGFIDGNYFQSFCLLNFALFALLPTVRVLVQRKKLALPDILVHCGAHIALLLLLLFRFGKLPVFSLRYVLIVAAVLPLVQLPLVRSADKVDRNWSVLQLIFAAGALLCLIPHVFSDQWIMTGRMVLMLILLALGIHLNSITLTVGSAVACAFSGWKILLWDLIVKGLYLSEAYLSGLEFRLANIGVFIAGLLLVTGLIAYSKRKYPALFERMPMLDPFGFCIGSLSLLFIYSSLELYWMFDALLPVFRNGGLSLWWGLWAILLLLSGILAKQNLARRISLVLFGVCAVKIFLVDLRSLHALYKVSAFVVLGLLMLGGAILYTRFKDRIFKN